MGQRRVSAFWAQKPVLLACVLGFGAYGEVLRLIPGRTGCLECNRAGMAQSFTIERELETVELRERLETPRSGGHVGLSRGLGHYAVEGTGPPTTAVPGDLHLVAGVAAKAITATLLERAGYREQRLAGDHALIGLRPSVEEVEPPFDEADRVGKDRLEDDRLPARGLHDLRIGEHPLRILLPAHVKRRILREAAASSDGKETGGILLWFGGPGGPCWVTEAAGPGPRAVRSATRFMRDLDHSEAAAEAAFALDGSLWLGDWHTHPGGPAALSSVDLHSYRRVLAASDMGLQVQSMIGHVARSGLTSRAVKGAGTKVPATADPRLVG